MKWTCGLELCISAELLAIVDMMYGLSKKVNKKILSFGSLTKWPLPW